MGVEIEFLQAEHGDCIFISYMNKNILIDTGTRNTYYEQNGKKKKDGALKKKISKLKSLGQKINLLVMSHVDNDHIGGVMKWLKMSPQEFKNMVSKVWFNSGKLIYEYLKFEGLIWSDKKYQMNLKDFNYQYNRFYDNSLEIIFSESSETSIQDGVTFEQKLEEYGIWDRKLIIAGEEYNEFNNITFKILSPTKETLISLLKKWHKEKPDSLTNGSKKLTIKEKQTEDYKKRLKSFNINKFKEDDTDHNGSSIAFILEIENKKFLFLADAFPSVICTSLEDLGSSSDNKLEVSFVKIAHHGSQKNTNMDLLKIIKSDKYIVSTNGQKYGHPNKITFSRLVKENPNSEIYLNYPKLKDKIFLKDDFEDYPNFKVYSTKDLKI